jgi:hypothetical protein
MEKLRTFVGYSTSYFVGRGGLLVLLVCLLAFNAQAQKLRNEATKKHTEADLIGQWETEVTEEGVSLRIQCTFFADKTALAEFFSDNDSTETTLTESIKCDRWRYDGKFLYEKYAHMPREIYGKIDWINPNYFVITIIYNGSKAHVGLKRHYHRRIAV